MYRNRAWNRTMKGSIASQTAGTPICWTSDFTKELIDYYRIEFECMRTHSIYYVLWWWDISMFRTCRVLLLNDQSFAVDRVCHVNKIYKWSLIE